MADFNINIAAVPNIPLEPNYDKVRQGDCLTGVTSIPIGMVNDTNTPGIQFLLSEYTGANGYDTIRISNLLYTDESNWFLEYNGVPLVPNVDPNVVILTVDVTAVAVNAAIPLFLAKYDNDAITGNATIAFDFEVEDTLGTIFGKVRAGVIFLYVECIPPVQKATITEISVLQNGCETTRVVRVNVPAEGSRYVSKVESDGFASVTGGTFPATITVDTEYTLKIDADNSGPNGIYSVAQLLVKESATSGTFLSAATVSRNHTGNIC